MSRTTPQEYADKWGQRTKAATADYRRGVEKVTEAPGEAAARQADAMLAGVTRAIQDGTWASQVRKVSLQEWKDRAITKGVGRIAAGVDAAAPKQVQMAQQLLAAVDASVEEVNRTPRGDLETNINRMVTFARSMAQKAPRRQG